MNYSHEFQLSKIITMSKNYRNKIIILALSISIALASCTTEQSYDFTGTWFCEEDNSVFGQSQYNVTITESPTNKDSVFLYNFNDLGQTIYAVGIINENHIQINTQTVDNLNISGSGILSGSTINMNYTVSAGGIQNVTAVYTR